MSLPVLHYFLARREGKMYFKRNNLSEPGKPEHNNNHNNLNIQTNKFLNQDIKQEFLMNILLEISEEDEGGNETVVKPSPTLIKMQPWLSSVALVFALTALYHTVFELVYDVNTWELTNSSPPLAAKKDLETSYDASIPFVPLMLAISLQTVQLVSVFLYFISFQMGRIDRIVDLSVYFLWYPLFCAIVTFAIFPNFYVQTMKLTAEVLILCTYHMWLIITIKYSYEK